MHGFRPPERIRPHERDALCHHGSKLKGGQSAVNRASVTPLWMNGEVLSTQKSLNIPEARGKDA